MEDNDQVDQICKCVDCGENFNFTPAERRFYLGKNLFYPPKRCPKCRKIRRSTIDNSQMPDTGKGGE